MTKEADESALKTDAMPESSGAAPAPVAPPTPDTPSPATPAASTSGADAPAAAPK
jgi:hypothetical protein